MKDKKNHEIVIDSKTISVYESEYKCIDSINTFSSDSAIEFVTGAENEGEATLYPIHSLN